jgi:hypothetical protein
MKMSLNFLTAALLILGAVSVMLAAPALADPAPLQQIEDQKNNQSSSSYSLTEKQKNDAAAACQSTNNSSGNPSQKKVEQCLSQSPIVKRINEIVNFLSAGVAVIVTGVILVGGIQYIMAGGNATALTAARQRIMNGVIALFAFLFMFAFLQWLIPGGIFK